MQSKLAQVLLALILACGLAQGTGPATPHYVETGECQGEQLCSYSYSAQQRYQDNGEDQKTQVDATVDITCTSSGLYNDSDARLYCMAIRDASIMSNSLENSTAEEIRVIQKNINDQLGNWFCFVQSYNGKIPAVYHSPSEPDHAISLKKAIAAAFQANFEGTLEEEEIDPQSRHTSHYTYTPTMEEGLLKMHRTVLGRDVNEYSNQAPTEEIDTTKDEDIQYRSGRLERSSGRTTFRLVNESEYNTDVDSFSLSQAFSASGSYSMDLQTCRKLNKYAFSIQKRRIFLEMSHGSKEEGLKATMDTRRERMEEMKMLRAKLPSGSASEALLNYDAFGDKLVYTLEVLMELESQYGALPSFTPVIDEILSFATKMPRSESTSDRRIREAVIMLLSAEGSLKAQMALLNAYDNAFDSAEANVILTQISFMKTVRIGFVIGIEERLNRPSENEALSDQMLLVFGSLATKGSDEVEDRIMKYLNTRVAMLKSQTNADLSDAILLLHVLGNTGSKLSISPILSFLDTSVDDYMKIKLAVVDSLSKVTDDPIVLNKLEELLREESSVECTAAVLETLVNGLAYVKSSKQDVQQYIITIKTHSIVYSLAEAVSYTNDTDLHNMMDHYLTKIKADEDLFALIYNEYGPLGSRGKRQTTNWGASHSDYNYVDSLANRQSDVNTYTHHRAYLNSKTIGVSDANVKVAYGYFAGTGTHCDRVKAYGRCVVVGKLLTITRTLFDMKVDIRATTTSISVTAYVRVNGNSLLDYSYNRALTSPCRLYTRNLAEFRSRIFTLRYDIFVYAGYLTLSVGLDAVFNLDLNANLCIGRTGTEVTGALGALTPTVGIILSGGVTGNLLEVARGGVSVSASFNYRLEPAASVQGCTAYCSVSARICIGIYDSFPTSYLSLETWYQIRNVAWCGSGWFQYPCIIWGSRTTVDSLSASWNLGSQGRRAVWQQCLGNLHPTCAAGALSSPLFSY